ncbi:MAG: DUF3783 domain-containing protein [Lachnospiraceae bacterium]
MSKTIIVNNIKADKQSALEKLCKDRQVRIKKVPYNFLGQPVGFLAQIPGMKKTGGVYKGSAIDEEVMVFADFDDKELDDFLDGYRQTGMENVQLKAVVTPSNMKWTFVELYNELVRERNAYMAAQAAVENTI